MTDERLRRVEEALLAAGPPPDLPPSLERPPAGRRALRLPRRAAAFTLAAALATAAFAGGYAAGDRGEGFETRRVVALQPTGPSEDASAVIRIGAGDGHGNWPMLVEVEGLEPLPRGDYYALYMTSGDVRVACGTFNVADADRSTVRFTVAYRLDAFEGWLLTHYTQEGHEERPLMRG